MRKLIRYIFLTALLLSTLLVLPACSSASTELTYTQITMEEAKAIFEQSDSLIIVDVRRSDEYDSGHIPNAINIPNESIGDTLPEDLPDPDETIYIYCRSGNRSKQAAEKLVKLGYSHIVEFGGIIDWTGEIE